ncbi:MAG: GNAT family N-acetyltransferase [Candidatus Thorarchaeota archaeon]
MKIRPYKDKDKLSVISVLSEVYKDINPTVIINEEVFDSDMKVEADQTILSHDYIVAEDDNGEIIGFAGLYKSSKRDYWFLDLFMLPKFFKTKRMVELFNSIFILAKEQDAPELRYITNKYRFEDTPLHNEVKKMGLEPVNYGFWMRLDDLSSQPQLKIPNNIKIQKEKVLNDISSYVTVHNDAFSKHFNFRPITEEELKVVLEGIWKDYDKEHWLAYDDDKLVGICSSTINPELEHIGTITTLGLLHEYHRRGIGSSLLGHGVHSLIEKGCKQIELGVEAKNEKALNLYKKFGFNQVESRTIIVYTIK